MESKTHPWKSKAMECKNAIACAKRGDVDFFKTVAPEILLNGREVDGDTVLTVAAIQGQDKSGRTALHLAVEKGNHKATKLFLEAACDFELLRNNRGQTCLHIAAEQGELDMVKLICEADLDKQLLSMPDSQGNTPLHLAVENSNLEIVRLLNEGDMVVDYGANNSKQTPFLLAISKVAQDGSGSDSEVICNLLLTRNWSQCTKRTGDMGWTPLHYAVSYRFIGAVEEISRLCPNYIGAVDSHGQTPYMIATQKCYQMNSKNTPKS